MHVLSTTNSYEISSSKSDKFASHADLNHDKKINPAVNSTTSRSLWERRSEVREIEQLQLECEQMTEETGRVHGERRGLLSSITQNLKHVNHFRGTARGAAKPDDFIEVPVLRRVEKSMPSLQAHGSCVSTERTSRARRLCHKLRKGSSKFFSKIETCFKPSIESQDCDFGNDGDNRRSTIEGSSNILPINIGDTKQCAHLFETQSMKTPDIIGRNTISPLRRLYIAPLSCEIPFTKDLTDEIFKLMKGDCSSIVRLAWKSWDRNISVANDEEIDIGMDSESNDTEIIITTFRERGLKVTLSSFITSAGVERTIANIHFNLTDFVSVMSSFVAEPFELNSEASFWSLYKLLFGGEGGIRNASELVSKYPRMTRLQGRSNSCDRSVESRGLRVCSLERDDDITCDAEVEPHEFPTSISGIEDTDIARSRIRWRKIENEDLILRNTSDGSVSIHQLSCTDSDQMLSSERDSFVNPKCNSENNLAMNGVNTVSLSEQKSEDLEIERLRLECKLMTEELSRINGEQRNLVASLTEELKPENRLRGTVGGDIKSDGTIQACVKMHGEANEELRAAHRVMQELEEEVAVLREDVACEREKKRRARTERDALVRRVGSLERRASEAVQQRDTISVLQRELNMHQMCGEEQNALVRELRAEVKELEREMDVRKERERELGDALVQAKMELAQAEAENEKRTWEMKQLKKNKSFLREQLSVHAPSTGPVTEPRMSPWKLSF